LGLAGALLLLLAPACFGQYNTFLRIAGVPGESTAAGHVGDNDATGFTLGVSNSIGGAATFPDVSVTKYVDKATPKLLLFVAQSTVIPTVTLFVQSTLPSNLDYYKVVLTNAKVTNLTDAGLVNNRPTETLTFSFQKIEIDYTARNSDGSGGTPITACWDRSANAGC
jgi:type VI secretion system secreted protein Hcp